MGRLLLEKSGLVFPKLKNVTIHINSTLSENTRQNSEYKIMTAKEENNTKYKTPEIYEVRQ